MMFEPGDSDELDFAMAVLRRLREAAREEGC